MSYKFYPTNPDQKSINDFLRITTMYSAVTALRASERSQIYGFKKIQDGYIFNVAGLAKDGGVHVEIDEKGYLKVLAACKKEDQLFEYDYSVYVGDGSKFKPEAQLSEGLLTVKLNPKESKVSIPVN